MRVDFMNQLNSLPRVSLSNFLSNARDILSQYRSTPLQETSQLNSTLTFVIGNESAAANVPATLYIPLLNIPRTSLRLRPELAAVLQHANLTSSDILTLSDLPESLPPPEQTRWLLVDHNVLTGELGKIYGHRIVGCIDHHEDEGLVPFGDKVGEGLDGEPRIIEQASSCASLVTAWARDHWQSATQELAIQASVSKEIENRESEKWWQEDAQLSRLALAPILIDSACLKSTKTKTKDISSAIFLEKLIMRYEVNKYNRTEFFNQVSAAKQDLSSLSLTDILHKDYKQWAECNPDQCLIPTNSKIGIAAVVQPISYLITKAASPSNFLQILFRFAQEKDLSLLAVMTTSYHKNQGFQRELLVWGLDKRGVQTGKFFEKMAGKKLGLQKWVQKDLDLDLASTNEGAELRQINLGTNWRRCWIQLDAESSRKQVAPLLRVAMKRILAIF